MLHPLTRAPAALLFPFVIFIHLARPCAAQEGSSYRESAEECRSGSACVLRLGVPEMTRGGISSRLTQLENDLGTLTRLPGSPLARRELPVSPGSDYQVYTWLREGSIDAGVVSPLAAYLLERDGVAFPVAEVRGEDLGTGSRPIFAVAENGEWSPDSPLEKLDDLISVLVGAGCRHSPNDTTLAGSYTLYLESHLSASGFMAPLLLIDQRLRRLCPDLAGEARDRFWQRLVDLARFEPPGAADSRQVFVFSSLGKSVEELRAIESLFPASQDCGGAPRWLIYPIVGGADVLSFCRAEGQSPGSASPTTGSYIVPNDVLVVRPEAACRLLDPGAEAHSGRGCVESLGDLIPELGSRDGSRPAVARLQPLSRGGARAQFAQQIRRVFAPWGSDSWLHSRYDHWYVEGHYEFTIGELFGFIEADQRRPGNEALALVLPGGGVKSVYQAGILDRLYCSGFLANGHTPPDTGSRAAIQVRPRGCAETDGPGGGSRPRRPLHVRSVIGTSGGAMVGFLVALQPFGHWGGVASQVEETAMAGVFAGFDIPRMLSILLLFSILVALLLFIRPTLRELQAMKGEDPSVPRVRGEHALPVLRRIFLAWPLLAFPLAVRVTGLGDEETLRALESILYGGLVILVHFVLTTFRQPSSGEVPLRSEADPGSGGARSHADLVGAEARVIALLGATLVLGAIAGRILVPEGFLREGLPLSILASSGIFCLYLGQIMDVWASRSREPVRVVSSYQYLRGMGFVAMALLGAYGVFAIAVLLRAATHLELTGRFWLVLILIGLATFGTLTLWVTKPQRPRAGELGSVGRWLRARMLWLGESDDAGSWLTSPGTRLLALGTFGTLVWLGFVVPGLYGNKKALEGFQRMAEMQVYEHPAESGGRTEHEELLHANLIVTGALLSDHPIADDDRELHEGDLYFCFSGPEGCQTDVGPRWLVGQDPDLDVIVHAVFSSGSPFPVLPAHRARLPDGTQVPLVDGGYAHNIPFEAALLSGARQVLAVHSTPLVDRDEAYERGGGLTDLPGRMTRGVGRIFSFLFARAQELDRSRARGMFVASLAPRPTADDGRYPSMTEFTVGSVERLKAMVRRDFTRDRRIGRVESWGTPVQLRVIHAEGGG